MRLISPLSGLAEGSPCSKPRSRTCSPQKVAALAALAAAATGGIALAAATGNLPGPLQDTAHSAFGAPAVATDAADPSDEPSESVEPTQAAPQAPVLTGSETSSGSASPSPSLDGLCKAFQAKATSNPGKALANPAFSVLVSAAGGTDKVTDFCVTRVGPAATHGVPPTHPAGAPSTHAGDHPTGAPATHPTGARPSGLPTHPQG